MDKRLLLYLIVSVLWLGGFAIPAKVGLRTRGLIERRNKYRFCPLQHHALFRTRFRQLSLPKNLLIFMDDVG